MSKDCFTFTISNNNNMTEYQLLDYPVTIHWWNGRSKTLDFQGKLKDCLKEKGITFRKFRMKDDESYVRRYRFKFTIGSSKMTYDWTGDVADGAIKCLQFQLVYLGDKSQIYFMSRTRTINH